MTRALLAVSAALALAACSSPQTSGPVTEPELPPIPGVWEGVGQQVEPAVELPLVITFAYDDAGELVGDVVYLADGCRADLVPTGTPLTFTEEVSEGRARCVSGGLVTIARDGQALSWTWAYPDGAEGAHGTLTPAAAAPEAPSTQPSRTVE